MKSSLLMLLLTVISTELAAQCNTYFPMRENVKVHYDFYDRKEKLTLRMTQKLINVTGSGNAMKGTMVQELIEVKKNELIGSYESEWNCQGGTVHFNINNMAFTEPAMAGSGMTMDVSGDQMDLPSSLQVGQNLKDLSYQLKMGMNGMSIMNRTFTITDRKVEAEESITTPAGSFSCLKVSFTTTSKGGIGGGTTKSVMWYAKDVGLVKAETFSDNGKLLSRQVLNKIEK
jgi:hypothetical protein